MTEETQELPESYACMAGAEWFAIVARNNLAFSFGPYTGPEVGELMKRATEEGVPLVIRANCGREFDWELARDFGCGEPANWQPMETAPQDGTVVIGDIAGFERKMTWWIKWECWRVVAENDRDVGEPVAPFRWRPIDG